MTVRRTLSLPDDLDRAVLAAAGTNYSGFAQRALRSALVAHDLDLLAEHPDVDIDDDTTATIETDAEVELTAQELAARRDGARRVS